MAMASRDYASSDVAGTNASTPKREADTDSEGAGVTASTPKRAADTDSEGTGVRKHQRWSSGRSAFSPALARLRAAPSVMTPPRSRAHDLDGSPEYTAFGTLTPHAISVSPDYTAFGSPTPEAAEADGDEVPSWREGQRVEARDCQGTWYVAKVMHVTVIEGGVVLRVHFEGWTHEMDELYRCGLCIYVISIHPSIHLFICLCICLSICPSVSVCMYYLRLSVCLSLSLSLSLIPSILSSPPHLPSCRISSFLLSLCNTDTSFSHSLSVTLIRHFQVDV